MLRKPTSTENITFANAIDPPRPARRSPLIVATSLAWIGYLLLVVAWVMANPPFEAPDEYKHYVRALAVANDEFTGNAVPLRAAQLNRIIDPTVRARAKWQNASTRTFSLSSGQVSPVLRCNWFGAGPFHCSRQSLAGSHVRATSSVGTYPPLPYVVPGLSARLASNSIDGVRYGRAAGALVAALFLLVALLASADSRATLAASAFAVAPMVVFSAASLNTSSMEIAAGLCFAATGLRLVRGPSSGHWWIFMGLSGAALALSRSAGSLWLVLLAGMLFAVQPRLLRMREGRRGLALALAGLVAGLAWSATQEPRLTPEVWGFSGHLSTALRSLKSLVEGSVGNFGYLNVQLPGVEIAAWLLGLAVLIGIAALATERRGRVVLAAAVAACVLVPVGFDTLVYAQTGFAPQARHFLPFWVALPLLAGHLLATSPNRRLARPVLFLAATVVPVVQLLAWYANTRHWVEGRSGPLLLIHAHGWSPPLGVVPWFCMAIVGALALSLAYTRAATTAVR